MENENQKWKPSKIIHTPCVRCQVKCEIVFSQ